jgi:hypothetical protein
MRIYTKDVRTVPGSTGSLPVVLGSLPSTIFAGKLPTNAGWQPALPNPEEFANYMSI